jgi:hypothetical protein
MLWGSAGPPYQTEVETAWNSTECLKLKYDELLSNFVYKINLRRCTMAWCARCCSARIRRWTTGSTLVEVRRCSLPL